MSVVTMPRRVATPDVSAPRTAARHVAKQPSRVARWRSRSLGTKLCAVAGVTLLLVMAGNSYAAQRQVEIHQLQSTLLQEQAKYAAEVATLTNTAAPARVAAAAGRLHLVLPSSVTQISTVPLTVALPTPTLRGSYTVTTRSYR